MYLKNSTVAILRVGIILMIAFFLTGCSQPQPTPEPLKGFIEKVTAMVTSTIRGQLRDNPPKQKLLMAKLPSFEKMETMNQLVEELKGTESLKNFGYLIETDILFELQKPEHQYERNNFNSPEVQRAVVSAIITGMKKAMEQLKGGKDGN